MRACIKGALVAGVRWLTFYAFSTENWKRPAEEVEGLMELLCDSIVKETPELVEQGVRVVVIGARGALSEKVRRLLEEMEEQTKGGEKLTAVLAINYSGRAEITRAASALAAEAMGGELSPVMITAETFAAQLYTAGMPDPDLVIRTGGEKRLSNFLLWQAAYAELYFTDVMWPDFNEDQFREALDDYGRRERRFGKIR